ncbi:reverse transcriptase (RNA-dependent DNA polymerase) domain-containing protein [Phthorimaea operculella]|nr:reverse transcriptase (RNA-dependent DNA polymerase) domain-containing protein [Phthorimaea operculella]
MKPPLVKLSSRSSSFETRRSKEMENEIATMLKNGAIRYSNHDTGFLSTMFLRKKSDGTNRPIFNLKKLNHYVSAPQFRLINHQNIPSILTQDDFLAKIDISQAYYHVPIVQTHCRFLSLAFGGNVFEMTCLPFGLASAPYAFAKVTNWLAHWFRQVVGVRIVVYLDDFLLMHQNPEVLKEQVVVVIQKLKELGWCVNQKKSLVEPSRCLEYLGIIWNIQANRKMLSDSKVQKTRLMTLSFLRRKQWSWLDAKIILGKLNFASFVVPLGRLHCRRLQIEANKLEKKNRHRKCQISDLALTELKWWSEKIGMSSKIHHPDPTMFITTDAADSGWGAIANNQKFWGTWTSHQSSWHCNQKELWALYATLKRLGPKIQRTTTVWQTDNRTAAAYVTKQGGTRSKRLLDTTIKILHLCEALNCHLTARYIPGPYNGLADSLSRTKQLPEWHLKPTITEVIFQKIGLPEIDLFASHRSAVVPTYVSESASDKNSQFVDAFSRTWSYNLGWIFPPPALIPRVLHHLERSTGFYLLIAPEWNKAFWTPELKRRATQAPWKIPDLPRHLVDLQTNLPPAGISSLNLQVWTVRAGPIKYPTGVITN